MQKDLRSCFRQHLSAQVALTGPQVEDALRLRYRVYCEETGYENPAQFPDGLERDRYDTHSLQMLVRHRPTGATVGAVRLIMPCWWEASWSFPFETVCGPAGQAGLEQADGSPRRNAAEVSRFAVSRNALTAVQQLGLERWSGAVPTCDDPQRPAQLVALGLIALLFGVRAEYGIGLWYAMMEVSLARHLSKLGIDFHRIGPAVEHRGKRYPMTARVDDLLNGIAKKNPAFRQLIDEVHDAVLARGFAPIGQPVSPRPLGTQAAVSQPGGPFVAAPERLSDRHLMASS